jgi:lysophospholipase L1-like esterase
VSDLVRRVFRACRRGAAYVALAAAALLLALAVTPPVTVATFGQDVKVGAVAPSPGLGWSGPGRAELFGEGTVDTVARFDGPIRPLITWERFNRNAAAAAFIQASDGAGSGTRTVGAALAAGWTAYFVRLLVAAAVIGVALYLAVIGALGVVRRGYQVPSRGRLLLGLAAAAGLSLAVTVGCAALTVLSARSQLAGVSSLADLTGRAPLVPPPSPADPEHTDVAVAVIGDSTAAGVGNAEPADPTPQDTACGRSRDAYARVLQSATGQPVLNLACSSATIDTGLLGPQTEGGATLPAQVGVLKSLPSLSAVVVSVGANDVGWSDFLSICYALSRCDDQVSATLFQRRLDTFRIQYAQLLQQLSDLPSRPVVIVTEYYDPLGSTFDCTALQAPDPPASPPPGYGFAPAPGEDPQQRIAEKVEPLRSELDALNTVLQQGAAAFDFRSVRPDFTGHELCTPQPWVQGMSARFPFHPNAAGELAIAAAQLPQLAGVVR